ncbi:MAG: oxidoreductase [Paenibacillus sp.]|jgi:predicted dehydrogenase|nr:oxidoreductase [Paenibacillus sp.]
MSSMMRVGFIGAGGIAQRHLKVLKTMEDVQIVGIYDISKERTAEVAAQYGAKPFADPYELIDPNVIDAVFVCTPPFARSDYETTAARKGVHLFAEKPPGLDLPEVEAKLDIIQRSGIITSSGHRDRYSPYIEKAQEFLVGRQIDLVHSIRYHGLPSQPWLSIMSTSGGQLVDQTIHDIDMIRYLLGDFKDVYARFTQRSLRQVNPLADIYDVGSVAFTLQTGAVGSVTNTNLLPKRGRREIMLIGNAFSIVINYSSQSITVSEGADGQTFDFKVGNEPEMQTERQDRAFLDAVRTGNQQLVRCSYEEAYKTLKVVLAMNESALSGQPVQIG